MSVKTASFLFLRNSGIALLLTVFCTSNSLADSFEKEAQEIYYETLSPFCPGRALADCPTDQARELKQKILNDLQSGKSKQEVTDLLLKDFGPQLSAMPNLSGFNIFAWLVPVLLILTGLLFVIRRVLRATDEENSAH